MAPSTKSVLLITLLAAASSASAHYQPRVSARSAWDSDLDLDVLSDVYARDLDYEYETDLYARDFELDYDYDDDFSSLNLRDLSDTLHELLLARTEDSKAYSEKTQRLTGWNTKATAEMQGISKGKIPQPAGLINHDGFVLDAAMASMPSGREDAKFAGRFRKAEGKKVADGLMAQGKNDEAKKVQAETKAYTKSEGKRLGTAIAVNKQALKGKFGASAQQTAKTLPKK